MSKYFKTKSIEQLLLEAEAHPYKKTLGALNLTTLGIGAIIGAGIFVLTGTVAANNAGPAITISFIISAFACVFAALCYAELAAMIPISGSAYTYAYATMGQTVAWIIGWDLILEYLFASSTVAVGWSGYFVSFVEGLVNYGKAAGDLMWHFPKEFVSSPYSYSDLDGFKSTGALFDAPAVGIIMVITLLLMRGIKESTGFNNFMVVLKLTVILTFIGVGISYVDTENWKPFIPENTTGVFGKFGWSGIFRGAGIIFFAYIGFDAVSTAAQEAKNPQRDMPRGILISLLVSTLLYIAVALVLTGLVPYQLLNVKDPIAVGIDATHSYPWLKTFIKVGALAGLSSVILVMLMGQPRIFQSMGKDGLLPKSFAYVHPKFGTPFYTTLLTGIVAALIAAFVPMNILGELVSIGTLLAFAIVCGGVLMLRYKKPQQKRPFKAPFGIFTPIMGMAAALVQMLSLGKETWERLVIWMALGTLIYLFYSLPNLAKIEKLALLKKLRDNDKS